MRIFLKSLVTIIVIVIVAIIVIFFVTWSRVPDMLANSLSKKMKVPVEIEDVHLGMRSIEIDKLEIGNPKGSILPKAFSTDKILIRAPLMNYMHKQIVIDEVDLSNVYLGLEFEYMGSKKGNWSTIMNNFKESTKTSEQKNPRTVLIKKLIATNINIDLVYEKGGGKIQRLKPVDRMEFDNVTSEGGLPTEQITRLIVNQMLRQVFSMENLQDMLENILQNPGQGTLQKIFQPFKGVFNGGQGSLMKPDPYEDRKSG
ncbi:MAG TPA: AsmA family protein [Rhabdochlamydiaceae bacterium]|nr:AsmA family protein [Rhabdochlamydiaceae bacterium]